MRREKSEQLWGRSEQLLGGGSSSFDLPTLNSYYRLLQASVECLQDIRHSNYFCCLGAYIDIHSSIGDPHNQTTLLLQ